MELHTLPWNTMSSPNNFSNHNLNFLITAKQVKKVPDIYYIIMYYHVHNTALY